MKMRDCMDRRVTPPARVTSPTWGPPPSCKQALSPVAYIFQRSFSRGLFLEGLIFGGASLRTEICVSKSIGLALWWSKLSLFALFYFVFEGNFPSTSPRGGGLYLEGAILRRVFLRYRFGGLIFGGAYTWKGLFSEIYASGFENL